MAGRTRGRRRFSLYKALRGFHRKLGPGLITGVSDDDAGGIGTYSQAGARFGLATLWTALISLPLMIAVQEMCARIGIVTHHGLAHVIKSHYSRALVYIVMLLSFPAIVFNIGADIAAVGAVSNLLVPQLPTVLFSVVFTVVLSIALIRFRYRRMVTIMKWLCIVLLAYIAVPFLTNINWASVLLNAFVPTIKLDGGFILMLVAIFGTTISPYLFFWQTSSEVEEVRHRRSRVANRKLLKSMDVDVGSGMVFSNVVMFFIILTTGTVLFNANIGQIGTVDQAAAALMPLAGEASYLLFTIGIIGVSLIAIPVLAESLSYMYAEIRGPEKSMDSKFSAARGFYTVLIASLVVGLLINLTGISPISMLVYSAVVYGLIAPVLIGIILHISNNRRILGRYVNGKLSNVLGMATLVIMTVSAVLFIYFTLV